MQLHLHQTHQTVADFEAIYEALHNCLASGEGLHLFPELFLTGYPLQDICLQRDFIHRYVELLERIDAWSQSQPRKDTSVALIGGLAYQFDSQGLPLIIENVIFSLVPGKPLERLYAKRLLPNYDIFDEEKYFCAGRESAIAEILGKRVGLMICEDMWPSTTHEADPTRDLKALADSTGPLDLVVNLSASPWFVNKAQKRYQKARDISLYLNAPFAYVNRVGGEDEVLFDGKSFVVVGEEIIAKGEDFKAHTLSLALPAMPASPSKFEPARLKENTWEAFFSPALIKNKEGQTRLVQLNSESCEELVTALGFGIQEYARKCGFSNFLVALSGGIDSALVLTLMKLNLLPGQSLEAIFMPGLFSAPESYDFSFDLCRRLGIKLTSLPIKFFHSSMRNAFKDSFGTALEGLADENIQSRLRGNLLYARSNQTGAMVLNTSNKSEIAVGYSTLYGDSVGAISVLGDLYKSEVFALAHHINRTHGELIPPGIISRLPSAELRADQHDQQSLPPYERLDAILEGLLSYRLSPQEIADRGFEEAEVAKVYGLYRKSEYKRGQFCPILKVRPKSFGFGYRVPITAFAAKPFTKK
jgi:NAD+ synthase (glutamine-hydrolysing)